MSYCCEDLKAHAEYICPQHGEDCPDKILRRLTMEPTFIILIHDGGTSGIEINYCPWCGQRLSEEAGATT